MKNILALLLLVALVAAGCGGDDEAAVATGEAADPTVVVEPTVEVDNSEAEAPIEPSDDTAEADEPTTASGDADPAFPVTVAHGLGELILDRAPSRIVSLSPTATETLFAIGAGDQVIAVDDQSNFPAEAPMTDLSAFSPNVEAIIGFEPDLVISPGLPEDIEAGLAAAGIASMSLFAAASLDDVYSQIETLGAATGRIGDAAELVGIMQTDLAEILAEVADRETPVTFFHELDPSPYSVTSATFVGQVYTLVGLENIADGGDPEGFGYPLLSVEYILEKDPDLIFLADTKCCGESAETLAARAGWDQLSAVQNGNVIGLDDDIASRWGPRVVDFVRALVDATAAVELAPAA